MSTHATQPDLSFLDGHELAVYSTAWCPDCTRLKRWLGANGMKYREVDIDREAGAAQKLEDETGKRGVPYILIDGTRWVRGYHKELGSRFDPKLLVSELASAVRGS
jgi:glutaredoxin